MAYNIREAVNAVSNSQKRPFEIYILGPFLLWYASKDTGMNKRARRLLATAGAYVIMRHLRDYGRLIQKRKVVDG